MSRSEETASLATLATRLEAKVRNVVERHGSAVACAYLFGSAARGDSGPLSDLDLGIVFAKSLAPKARLEIAADLAGELQTVDGPLVDVAVLDEAPPALQHRAIRDGRVLVVADESRRVEFEVRAIREYLDFQPVLEQYDRALRRRALEGRFGS